jgi:hypothetical protein
MSTLPMTSVVVVVENRDHMVALEVPSNKTNESVAEVKYFHIYKCRIVFRKAVEIIIQQ